MGITKTGEKSNKLFCKLTGFEEPDRSNDPRGDAFKDNIWCEVKKDTYNQVRPYKYTVLIGHDTIEDEWYVMPPDDVVDLTYGKRGQHTTDPMEVCNLGKVNAKQYEKFKVKDLSLLDIKVQEAYLQGQNNVLVRDYATEKKVQYENEPQVVKEEIESLRKKKNA